MTSRMCFVLIDGLADVAVPSMGNQTPLEAAHTPHMDMLAKTGMTGMIDPVEPGLACGSDTAHLSLFGYPPQTFYRGRGAFESMGAGLDMIVGDIAFKSNFATLDEQTGIVVSRRADRNFTAMGPILCQYLSDHLADLGILDPKFAGYSVKVQYATEHRCGVRLRGPGLTDEIVGTDPLRDNLPLIASQALDNAVDGDRARFTAELVNAISKQIIHLLREHPINVQRAQQNLPLANCVLLRGAGVRIQTPVFKFISPTAENVMIAPTCCIRGLGICIGLEVLVPEGTTGDYESNLLAKAECAIDLFSSSSRNVEFVFLHVKCVDDAGHDADPQLKMRMIEKCDVMIGQLVAKLPADVAICVTGDHSTPCYFADHSHEPVPFLVSRCATATKYADAVQTFGESSTRFGVLGRFQGCHVMDLLRKVCSPLT